MAVQAPSVQHGEGHLVAGSFEGLSGCHTERAGAQREEEEQPLQTAGTVLEAGGLLGEDCSARLELEEIQ